MDLSNILVIAGKPDLSELVSQTKNGAIVANLVNNQKYPVFKNDRISSLGEIRIFTTSSEKPLEEVMEGIYNLLEAKPTDFDPKKADSATMFGLLEKVLPDYDTERVHASDVKKLFSWYNILLNAGKLVPTTDEEKKADEPVIAESEPAKKAAPKKAAAPKTAAPKASAKPKAAPKRTTTAKKTV